MKNKLTIKQQRFIDYYDGNATEAARKAGYKGIDNTLAVIGKENLRKLHIKDAIEKRNAEIRNKAIATREERQEFWTTEMNNSINELRDRLAASKLLGQSECDFIQKIQHETPEPIKLEVTVEIVKAKRG